jgi:hypothetical protein
MTDIALEQIKQAPMQAMEMIQKAFDAAINQGREGLVLTLARHISVDPVGGCWNWQAATNRDGYGVFTGTKSPVGRLAHRVSYFLATGVPPKGFDIHHRCKNRLCLNPVHIEMMPRSDHAILDSVNGAKTHCTRGHPFEGKNLYVRTSGKRQCRKCHAIGERRRRAQRGLLCKTS